MLLEVAFLGLEEGDSGSYGGCGVKVCSYEAKKTILMCNLKSCLEACFEQERVFKRKSLLLTEAFTM